MLVGEYTGLPMRGGRAANQNALSRILLQRSSFELIDEVARAGCQLAPLPVHLQAKHVFKALNDQDEEEYRKWKAQFPSILDNFHSFAQQAAGKRIAVFLDYDGTLTPIVKNPDGAFMSEQMRTAVRKVAQLFPTAIISGRGREKVQSFVQLKGLYYAGSHGMDIVGPSTEGSALDEVLAFQPAAKFGPLMDEVHDKLVERTKDIPGSSVEHNKFCVSVHFRNCAEEHWGDVVAAVEATVGEHAELRATRGRKVLEIRPQVDWDKGHALDHLLGVLGLRGNDGVLPIYIGDDRTDEDAFRVLRDTPNGTGILVSSKVKETAARFTLRDPAEVRSFLTMLVAWGRTDSNAWHAHRSCPGWRLVLRGLDSPNSSYTDLAMLESIPESNSAEAEAAERGESEVPNGGEVSAEAAGESRMANGGLANGHADVGHENGGLANGHAAGVEVQAVDESLAELVLK